MKEVLDVNCPVCDVAIGSYCGETLSQFVEAKDLDYSNNDLLLYKGGPWNHKARIDSPEREIMSRFTYVCDKHYESLLDIYTENTGTWHKITFAIYSQKIKCRMCINNRADNATWVYLFKSESKSNIESDIQVLRTINESNDRYIEVD